MSRASGTCGKIATDPSSKSQKDIRKRLGLKECFKKKMAEHFPNFSCAEGKELSTMNAVSSEE